MDLTTQATNLSELVLSYSIMNPVQLWNGLKIFRMSANSKLFSKYIITVILVSLEMSLPINHYSVFVLFVSSFQLEFYPSDYSSLINREV